MKGEHMKILYSFALSILFLSCQEQGKSVEVMKYPELESLMASQKSDVVVFNFWATWCGPCVKELPQFEQLLEEEDVEVVLVSFDFVEQLEEKVIPFLEKKGINSRVVLLDETDYDSFIDKIEPEWSGAIPATIMLDNRNQKRAFFEKEFKEGELQQAFTAFIN